MRCPSCHRALPFLAYLTLGRRKSLVQCPRCKRLARHAGYKSGYLVAAAVFAYVAMAASYYLQSFGVPVSGWLKGAFVAGFYGLAGYYYQQLVPARPFGLRRGRKRRPSARF